MASKYIDGSVKSEKGFYIGDICYALDDDVYRLVWGKQHNWEDGIIADPTSGYCFAVGGTAYGDGCYPGFNDFMYGVDAGVIGIVPLELVRKNTDGLGTIHECPGTAYFEFDEDGSFEFKLPDGDYVYIPTKDEDDDDEDEY